MTTVGDVLSLAGQQVGFVEGGGPDGKSGNITPYGKWYGLDGQPYCAMGVSWVFFHAGLPLPASTSKGFAYCPSGVSWFQNRGKWTHTPKPGYVVFFQFSGGRVDHTGIVESVNSDGSINTIEFNTSSGTSGSQTNGGGCYRRRRSGSIIAGYGIPDYTAASNTSNDPQEEDDDMKPHFYQIRDENNISQPDPVKGGGIWVTDTITTHVISSDAWVHEKGMSWWTEDKVELIPEALHNWLIANTHGQNS